ncbi:MAG: hypothetical protein DLM59_07215 [Pseudonocardiales bacterium]|nr:MAG: hypothetical protein DLM59_07215 [Pseudonocardiales bacterium]
MTGDQDFASTTLTRHVARGVLGFGALAGAVGLIPVIGPVSLVLAPVALVALRGCPTCWMVGLIQTISLGKLQRSCQDGHCELTVAGAEPSRHSHNQTRSGPAGV